MAAASTSTGGGPVQGAKMAGVVARQRALPDVLRTIVRGAALLAGLVLVLAIPHPASANPVAGVWVEGDCRTASRVRVINAFGLLDIIPLGDDLSLQVLVFEGDVAGGGADTLRRRVVSPNIRYEFDHEFSVEGGRLEATFSRCDRAPPGALWTFAEAIAAFEFAGRIADLCGRRDGPDCLEAAFRFVDVSGDGKLSPAEVARVFRMVGFFVGYFSHSEAIVPAKNLLGSTALAGLVGPFFANTMVEGMDYDADGSVSLDELMQDRGDAAGLFAAARVMEPTAAQVALKGAFATLSQLLRLLPL
jgi:hypothetical protein